MWAYLLSCKSIQSLSMDDKTRASRPPRQHARKLNESPAFVMLRLTPGVRLHDQAS
jgi:hypothetical protein